MIDKIGIDVLINNIMANLSFEGLEPSENSVNLSKKILSRKIEIQEARDNIVADISFKKKDQVEENIEMNNQSVYCYEDSQVYINKFDIKNGELLDQVEADLTALRLAELYLKPVKKGPSIEELKNIHYRIFQDLYHFAGQIRTEDISKGNTLFCKSEFIESSLAKLFNDLEKKNYFDIDEKNSMVEGIVFLMGELNIIHPFREGNGRCIRSFVEMVALRNKRFIDWSETNSEDILKAVIKTVNFDYSHLRSIIEKTIDYKASKNV